MNPFDSVILHFISSLAHRSWFFDKSVDYIGASVLFKGGVIIPILWLLWFGHKKGEHAKEYVLTTIMLSVVSLVIARSLAVLLPFRLRPMHDPNLHFVFPYGAGSLSLEGWSAFPSDHAVFFFTLATGIFVLSRSIGCFAFFHSLIFICLPRIYCGYHSPTDVIAGAMLGIGIGILVRHEKVRRVMTGRVLKWEREFPGIFYAAFFIVNYQMAILFEPIRDLGHRIYVVFK